MSVSDDDDLGDLTHTQPAYRRALWAVIVLNVGYGLVELVGGLLAESQSLLADSVDFIGDGSIALLALLAIGWGGVWRSRAALLQGVFLAAVGIAVLASTAYRVFVPGTPEAGFMGALGIGALLVNLAAAAIILRYRRGDASVRAVWLFSRNDALGNIIVLVAAVAVWATASGWPDLVAATIIAAIFLHSAWQIIRAARRELGNADIG